MNRMLKIPSLVLLSLVSGLFSCQNNTGDSRSGQKLHVVTTTGMLWDAVINIAGDSVVAEALMGPGVDPHLYKATQGDIQKLTQADLVIYNGLFLEGKMEEILERLGKTKPVLAGAAGIDKDKLRDNAIYQNEYDPHIWFDVQLWKEVVASISLKLQEMDPENAPFFRGNTQIFMAKLDLLHSAVGEQISQIPIEHRVLITAHDAFGYFGDAYHIEVKGLQGMSTQSEFGLRDITDLVKFIVERQVKSVFVETSVSERAIRAVVEGCHEKGFPVTIGGYLYSDAMGAEGSEDGTYIGMVMANVNTIVNALK